MAQLSDDCFAFGGPMMSVDEAVGLIAARVSKVEEIETVALSDADGRILAHDITAPLPLPPFTNSAVDGYAVASRDLPQSSGPRRRIGSRDPGRFERTCVEEDRGPVVAGPDRADLAAIQAENVECVPLDVEASGGDA